MPSKSEPLADQTPPYRDVIYKLLAFTFAMVVIPIGSYFVTVNTVFRGKPTVHFFRPIGIESNRLGRKLFVCWRLCGGPCQRRADFIHHRGHEGRPVRIYPREEGREQEAKVNHTIVEECFPVPIEPMPFMTFIIIAINAIRLIIADYS